MLLIVSLFTLVLAYGAFQQGAVLVFDGMLVACAIGVLACVYFGLVARIGRSPRSRIVFGASLFLIVWVVLQIVPLPFGVVAALSPPRADLAAAVSGTQAWTAITVVPAQSRIWLVRLVSFLLLMLIARDMAFRFPDRCRLLAIPVLVVAGGEAVLGLVQFFMAGSGRETARGTYVNRDHFAGLLEMVIPLTVMIGVGVYQRGSKRFETSGRSAVFACGLFGLAAVMLLAVVFSLSRMGFVASLAGLLFIGVVGSSSVLSRHLDRRFRWLPVAVMSLAIALSFVFLPTDELIARFAQTGNEDLAADVRVLIWKQSAELAARAPWTGFGLASYQSAFYPFKRVEPMLGVAHAHNDYLQGVIELGVIGMIPLLLLLGMAYRGALDSASIAAPAEQHYLGIGCAGGLFAITLHSLVDFNLYIPANTMTVAWVAGMAMGLSLSFQSQGRGGRRARES